MNRPVELRTQRLLLRRWRKEDRDAFAAMCGDERVMEFLPAIATRAESDAAVDRAESHFKQHGFGYWAVEIPDEAKFIGFVGLSRPRFEAAFTPCIEIGWRLASAYWGQGYATEAASVAVVFGFEVLNLPEILSFTVPLNLRSRRVMENIGMRHAPEEDFEHPTLPEGHPLRRHVLYRLTREDWEAELTGSHSENASEEG
ncbi:MAG: GNAT family N-acetyltransferase [Planctomycetia bacterium]|nr:GNAT family N-acetyltransferase [Planctomycetia bacterium]